MSVMYTGNFRDWGVAFIRVLVIDGDIFAPKCLHFCSHDFFSWANQDVKYDFTADLTGIGDRSVYEICET